MSARQAVTITTATTDQDMIDAKSLFAAYAKWLNVDLSFQDFSSELESLPGKYSRPAGGLLLARDCDGAAIGCAAYRSLGLEGHFCEMKRLYVLPRGRKHGLGKRLVTEILDSATKAGYYGIRLDTLNHMTDAIALYEKFGFERIDAYYPTPLPETVFLAKHLR